MKNLLTLALTGAFALSLAACSSSAPSTVTPNGTKIESDTKSISGEVTGTAVGSKTMIAIYGAYTNVSQNKIDLTNKTIDADTTLAVSPVTAGKYKFALPKAPQKAQAAAFKIFAFNDDNGNQMYDSGELQSKPATMTWAIGIGYQGAIDADGNAITSGFDDFKDFDFKLNS